MGGTMVDSQVLIYAFEHEQSSAKNRREQRAKAYREANTPERLANSAALVKGLDIVWVSAISLTEIKCLVTAECRDWIDSLGQRVQALEVDGRIADKAARMLRNRQAQPTSDLCPRCLNNTNGPECALCKRSLARYFRFADALVAATAEANEHIDVLYCYDSGLLDLRVYLKRQKLIFERPPNLNGPLFSRHEHE